MILKYVFFDLGYTLVYTKREKIFRDILLNMDKNADIEEIKIAYHLADKFFMREHKQIKLLARRNLVEMSRKEAQLYLQQVNRISLILI